MNITFFSPLIWTCRNCKWKRFFLQKVNHRSNLKQTGSFLIEQNSIPRELSKRFQLDVKLDTWNSHISLSSLGKNNKIITWAAQRIQCSIAKCLPFEIDQNCSLQYKNFRSLVCVEGWSEWLLGRISKKRIPSALSTRLRDEACW